MSVAQPDWGRSPPVEWYTYARVLLITWERRETDEETIKSQLDSIYLQMQRLKKVFQKIYKFDAEEWEIPRTGSQKALMRKLDKFESMYSDPYHLLIIYYGGHGSVVYENSHALWKCHYGDGSPFVNWSNLEGIFLTDQTDSDVLFLIDCCRAGGSVQAPCSTSLGNIVHVVAASGFDGDAPLSGDLTFTSNLIAELQTPINYENGAKVRFIADCVYNRLFRLRLPSGLRGVTSTNYVLREKGTVDRSIRLKKQAIPSKPYKPSDALVDEQRTALVTRGSPPAVTSGPSSPKISLASKPSNESLVEAAENRPLEDSGPDRRSSTGSAAGLDSTKTTPQLSDQDRDLLRYLYVDGMDSRNHAIGQAYPDTFEWVLEAPQFHSWLVGAQGVFWINGKAGCGKSTLMKMLSLHPRTREELSKWAGSSEVVVVLHAFWYAGREQGRSLSGFFQSILFQALTKRPLLIQIVRNAFQIADIMNSLREARLEMALDYVLEHCHKNRQYLCLFIDGLDELNSDQHDRFIGWIFRWSKRSSIKLCVSSRPWNTFREAFEGCASLAVQDFTAGDIREYVRSRLEHNTTVDRRLAPEQVANLVDEIVDKANGVFLWVHLVIRSILNGILYGDDWSTLLKRLERLPVELEPLYRSILENVDLNLNDRQDASKTFQIIMAAHILVTSEVSGTTPKPMLTLQGLHYALYWKPMMIIDAKILPNDPSRESYVNRNMSRWLNSFANGLLQVQDATPGRKEHRGSKSAQNIVYSHQTVLSFLEESYTREKLCESTAHLDFDPNLSLVGSALTQLKFFRFDKAIDSSNEVHELGFWFLVEQAMSCAARVEATYTGLLVQYLDELDRTMTIHIRNLFDGRLSEHWSNFLPQRAPRLADGHDNFLSLAITYSITLYVKAKIAQDPTQLQSKPGRPFLDYALVPSLVSSSTANSIEPELVDVLLTNGASPNEEFSGHSVWERFLNVYNNVNVNTDDITGKTERLRKTRGLLLQHGADKMIAFKLAFRLHREMGTGVAQTTEKL